MAIAVIVLFLLNLNGALATDGGSAWHSPASATTLSSSLASIGGYVWYDDDGDGVFDQGEGGLEGVTIYLYSGDNGGLLGTQTSVQDGNYQFSNLSAGGYVVQVADIYTDGLAEYALTTDNTLSVHLEEGEVYSGANFGYEALASPAEPTAVTLSSFMASSDLAGWASRALSFHWPWSAVLAALAVGGAFWIKQ